MVVAHCLLVGCEATILGGQPSLCLLVGLGKLGVELSNTPTIKSCQILAVREALMEKIGFKIVRIIYHCQKKFSKNMVFLDPFYRFIALRRNHFESG